MGGIEKAVEKQISLRLAEVNDKIVAVLLNEEEKIYREALNANAAVVSALNVATCACDRQPSGLLRGFLSTFVRALLGSFTFRSACSRSSTAFRNLGRK